MTTTAQAAITAARNRNSLGAWATHQFLAENNVPLRLYALAWMLEASQH